jgi:uncharacterized protein YecT (DUF1311 family)
MQTMLRWLAVSLAAAVALATPARPAAARPACADRQQGLDSVYCLMPVLAHSDDTLNVRYGALRAKLALPRRAALKADELAWLRRRDSACTRHDGGRLFVDLACAIAMTEAHARFLAARYRTCVAATCSDLDFYNTQDGAGPDVGPQLAGYPAISRYHGRDAGYIAVYTHDDRDVLYPVGGGIYVAGFIRLRGRYEGRIFRPDGYATVDISADRNFKALTDALFPGHRGGTWAGGDTGGFVTLGLVR